MNAEASDVKGVIDEFYKKKLGLAKGRGLHINTGICINRFGEETKDKPSFEIEDIVKIVDSCDPKTEVGISVREIKKKYGSSTTGLPEYPEADIFDAWDYSFVYACTNKTVFSGTSSEEETIESKQL